MGRTSLVNMLEKSEDWELALKVCVINKGTTGNNGNKVLLSLWGAGQASLPTILSSARRWHLSDIMLLHPFFGNNTLPQYCIVSCSPVVANVHVTRTLFGEDL